MPTAEAKYVLTAEDRTDRAFTSVRSKFGQVAKVAAGAGLAIAAGVGAGFAKMAKDAIDSADEIGKLSRELGVSTENLSEMQGVLQLVGGDFNQYTNSIRRMQRSVVDFRDGSASMVEAFDAIGISVRQLEGLRPEQQFDLIVRGLAGVADETERSARAQEIFGRGSRTVLRLVTTGADEVARLRAEQEALGNTLSQDSTQAAERFNDAIARMGQALRGAVTTTVTENIDDIVVAMESIVGVIPDVIRGISAVAGFVKDVGTVLGGGAAAAVAAATGNFGEAGSILGQVGQDVFGGNAEAVAERQDQTNQILRDIAREGLVGRAG